MNCLMLYYVEMKQHGDTVFFTVGKILRHCSAKPYSVLHMISLDFNETLQSAPVLTLTHVDDDSPQDSSCIFTTKAPILRASVNSSCQRNSSFTQTHLAVGCGHFATGIPLPI